MKSTRKKLFNKKIAKALVAPCNGKFRLSTYDPAWRDIPEMRDLTEERLKKRAKDYLNEQRALLRESQEKLYADNRLSLLIIFQAMDAAGKDTTIKHVMNGVNPQGCQVFSFKHPSATELDHNFLWRYWQALPERGRIGIFNRSYYEDVLVVRVHPELVESQRLPGKPSGKLFWKARYEDINAFEKHLSRNGTIILKFFLNLSKEEQRQRFIERLTNQDKLWKYAPSDLAERGYWDEYQKVYEEAIAATSTALAPWHIIPADNKWVMRALVSAIITETIASLDVDFPKVTPQQMAELHRALTALRNE